MRARTLVEHCDEPLLKIADKEAYLAVLAVTGTGLTHAREKWK